MIAGGGRSQTHYVLRGGAVARLADVSADDASARAAAAAGAPAAARAAAGAGTGSTPPGGTREVSEGAVVPTDEAEIVSEPEEVPPLAEDPMPTSGDDAGALFEQQRQWLARRTLALSEEARETLARVQAEAEAAGSDKRFVLWTLSDDGIRSGVLNWARHLKRIGVPHVVGALDTDVHAALKAEGTPTYLLKDYADLRSHLLQERSLTELNNDVHHKSLSWQLFETQRIGGPRALVHAGFDTLLSDTDVVWMRDPRPHLYCEGEVAKAEGCELLKGADMMISSDRMSAKEDDQGLANYAKFGTLNTGIVFTRATRAGKLSIKEWYRHLVERDGDYARMATDQQVFNAMAAAWDANFYMPEAMDASEDVDVKEHRERLELLKKYPSRAVRMMLKGPPPSHPEGERWPPMECPLGMLPLRYFANGHQFFTQRTQVQPDGGSPYCAHATYTGAGVDGTNHASKTTRFKEEGLWLVADDYDGADAEQYLTWDPELSEELRTCEGHADCTRARPCQRDDDQCPFSCHARVAAHQLAQFRGALAVARALGRTLVFPRLLCHCDRAWDGHGETIQHCCKYTGAETENYMPMESCPWDLLLPRNKMLSDFIKWREVGFLEGPYAPKGVTAIGEGGTVDVIVQPRGVGAAGLAPATGELALPAGATASEVRSVLGTARARVLVLRSARHAFCSFDGTGGDGDSLPSDADFDLLTHGPLERKTSEWFYKVEGNQHALEPAKSLLDPHPTWCSEVNKPYVNCTQNFPKVRSWPACRPPAPTGAERTVRTLTLARVLAHHNTKHTHRQCARVQETWHLVKYMVNKHKGTHVCCYTPELPARLSERALECQEAASAAVAADAR